MWFPEVDNKPISKTSRISVEVSTSNSLGDIEFYRQSKTKVASLFRLGAPSGFPLVWIEPFIDFYLQPNFKFIALLVCEIWRK